MNVNPPEPGLADDPSLQFVRLLGEHEHALNVYVLALMGDWNDANDVMQEVRIRLWQQFEKFDAATDFGAWARTVAYYLVLSHRSSRKRDRLCFSDDVIATIAEEAAAQADTAQQRIVALDRCMKEIPLEKRELLQRHYGDGQSVRALAQTKGQTYEAVRKNLFRLRQLLRECIDRRLAAGEVE